MECGKAHVPSGAVVDGFIEGAPVVARFHGGCAVEASPAVRVMAVAGIVRDIGIGAVVGDEIESRLEIGVFELRLGGSGVLVAR